MCWGVGCANPSVHARMLIQRFCWLLFFPYRRLLKGDFAALFVIWEIMKQADKNQSTLASQLRKITPLDMLELLHQCGRADLLEKHVGTLVKHLAKIPTVCRLGFASITYPRTSSDPSLISRLMCRKGTLSRLQPARPLSRR